MTSQESKSSLFPNQAFVTQNVPLRSAIKSRSPNLNSKKTKLQFTPKKI